MWLRFYTEDKVGVSIIDSFPHCHTENVLKTGKNQEMWLRYYIEDKNGVSIIVNASDTEAAPFRLQLIDL